MSDTAVSDAKRWTRSTFKQQVAVVSRSRCVGRGPSRQQLERARCIPESAVRDWGASATNDAEEGGRSVAAVDDSHEGRESGVIPGADDTVVGSEVAVNWSPRETPSLQTVAEGTPNVGEAEVTSEDRKVAIDSVEVSKFWGDCW